MESVELVPDIKVENVEINVSNTITSTSEEESKNKLNENDKAIIKEFLNKNYRISNKDIYIS